MDHGWGRSYSLWSVPFKIKQKALSEAKTLFKKGKKIINKTKSVSRANTLLWGKEKKIVRSTSRERNNRARQG